jgi:outer membrane protein assembly factor BamE
VRARLIRATPSSPLSDKLKTISCFCVLVPLLLAGCQRMPALPGLTPHKIDIQQGNVVTQDMVAKLKPGMSKSQVRFALGTPLVVDPFHNDRWDYVYVQQKRGRVTEQRRIVVLFSEDKLLRIDGDVVPAATAAAGVQPAAIDPNLAPAYKPDGTPVAKPDSEAGAKPLSETPPVEAAPLK